MKKFLRGILVVAFAMLTLFPNVSVVAVKTASAASGTGYTSAGQVNYQKVTDGNKQIVLNWGAREEDCTFLSTYAESFYIGNYTYESLASNNGGSSQSNAKNSALYTALQNLMSTKHTYETSYDWTRYRYRYTDCEKSNSSTISCFYTGNSLSGTWDSGSTWNREHTWPKSKSLNGNTTVKTGGEECDIMMLRPSTSSINSSRGNKAYGNTTDSNYYFPNSESNGSVDVRGDCARIFLYVFVRWNNNGGYAWGTNGVMESMNVLLEWMESDPVDTWEMGRNDAVQSITGTRNVFVDYPELAWKLFGQPIPQVVTPSGIAKNGTGSTPVTPPVNPDPPVNPNPPVNPPVNPDPPTNPNPPVDVHQHDFSNWVVTLQPTETTDGEKLRTCYSCGVTETAYFSLSGCVHEYGEWITLSSGKICKLCALCHNTVIKEPEGKNNATKTIVIVTASVGGAAVLGVVLFFILKKKV